MAKIVLVSLRCNPAMVQHLIAYAKAFSELGEETGFLLHPAYRNFPELESTAPVFEPGSAASATSWSHALFINAAVENTRMAVALKQRETKILYLYHEPWQMSLRYLRDEGLAATLRAISAHHFTVPILRIADTVILASAYGLRTYRQSDLRLNPNCKCLPLLYDDEDPRDNHASVGQKAYFGYVGNPCRSHGFDQFVSFIRYAFQLNLDFRFLIASRYPLPAQVLADPFIRRHLDKIEIRCGRPLTNDEINHCYAECFCVWNLYRRSTQSGVLPKAFMFGAPVIVSRIGSFPEYVCDGVNGRFAVPDDKQGIRTALEDMRNNAAAYAVSCRKTFLETFFYRSHLPDLQRMLQPPHLVKTCAQGEQ